MACYKPLKGYRSDEQNPSGKYSIVFNPGKKDLPSVEISCGQCIGCRLNRSKNWAIRLMHESTLHESSYFLTLTYSQGNLPPHSSLRLEDFQKFLKRLRKHVYPQKLRFFHCGEYGETTLRPHYHAIIFSLKFCDLLPLSQTPQRERWYSTAETPLRDPSQQKNILYTSPTLDKLWGLGFATIGAVTFESAAYVARYICKKVTGREAETHYQQLNPLTGEVVDLKPEYVTMSRRPGIAKAWFEKYSSDVYPDDFVLCRGKKMVTPKFYDKQLEKLDPVLYEHVKQKREVSKKENKDDNTRARLEVKEEIAFINLEKLKRNYESGT